MASRIHNVHVFAEGGFVAWKFDEDYTNYMELSCVICQHFLGDDFGKRNVRLNMDATIRDGEWFVSVEDDRSMMEMFTKNTNPTDVIRIEVEIEDIEVVDDQSPLKRRRHSGVVIEELDDDVVAATGQSLAVSTIVMVNGPSDPTKFLLAVPPTPDEEMPSAPDEMDDAVGVGAEDGDNHGDNDADEQLHSSSEQSSEDSDDPGWKQDLYESSESSEDDVSLVNSSDGSGVAAELDYHSSEEDCLKQGKRTNDRGSDKDVDPSKNIPRGPPLYDSRGRVVLSINQQFNDHVHFRTFLLDYAI